MPAPISVILPSLNAAASLPGTLERLMPGLSAGLIREVVISDGGSTDDTQAIAEAVGAVFVTGPASRGGQLRRGAEAARGEWLLFMHADTHLTGEWAEALSAHIAAGQSQAGYFPLRFRASGPWPMLVAGWANLRSRLFGLPYGDQALFLSRGLYDRVGGYRDIPLMEDVAIARALRGHLVMLDGRAETSAARYQAEGWARRGARNLWLLARYLCGADPDRLARAYRRG